MSAQRPLPPAVSPPATPGPFVRVEYLGFQKVADHREFRFCVYRPHGGTEFRLRIAIAAFGARGVSLQDGPDVCYQTLLRVVAAGAPVSPDVITIDDAALASYREAHTRAPKHRSWTPLPPPTPAIVPPKEPRTTSPPLPVAPLVHTKSALGEGQRVSHAVFGVGVTTSSSRGHTVVRFDQDGPKTFITSMLEVDVLSAPHTWETSARGTNRPCRKTVAS